MVPGLFDRPTGCLFAPRCSYANDLCRAKRPQLLGEPGSMVRCHFPLQLQQAQADSESTARVAGAPA
jgi:dipeptide transport system ATP-binding protein